MTTCEQPRLQMKPAPPRRNRIALSCSRCRQSKLKCDRNDPCSQCTRKGTAAACVFPLATVRRKPAVSMQNRLKNLESLVRDAMATLPTVTENMGRKADLSNGQIIQGTKETTYIGATHWAAILGDVCPCSLVIE